jgi:hypothetical protein
MSSSRPHIDPYLIHIPYDPLKRMRAVRHLQAGGSPLTFSTGKIEPDPALGNGDDIGIADWLPTVEILLRKAPEARLVLAIISGILLPRFAFHPLTKIRKDPVDQRRLAAYLQIIWHLLFPRAVVAQPRISFSAPLMLPALTAEAISAHI